MRGDLLDRLFEGGKITFQSTPLREGRLGLAFGVSDCVCFNPRPYVRGDSCQVAYCSGAVFQSTPLREGRLTLPPDILLVIEFQSTPLREGRHLGTAKWTIHIKFQSTPLREGRRSLPQ